MAYNPQSRVGGLTTFPSMHNWKRGGEAYAYYTEGNPAIMILFYEHLSFILNQNISADKIIDVLNSYNTIFPYSSKDQTIYWNGIIRALFDNSANFYTYMREVKSYILEKVLHSKELINNRLSCIDKDVDDYLNTVDEKQLRQIAKKALYMSRAKELHEQLEHIDDFRLK